jgi:hypothetical protein
MSDEKLAADEEQTGQDEPDFEGHYKDAGDEREYKDAGDEREYKDAGDEREYKDAGD